MRPPVATTGALSLYPESGHLCRDGGSCASSLTPDLASLRPGAAGYRAGMETSDTTPAETAPATDEGAAAGTPGAPAAGGIAAQDWSTASADPEYRAAVVDLLGALAYGELAAFERLAEDAKLAPTLADKAELASMASAEFHHFDRLRERLAEIGEEPTGAMEPFAAALDEFHRQTAPSDWLEGLIKAYVGDSIASDFYREVAVRLDADTRELVLKVLDDTGHSGFAVEKVRAAIEADPRVGGRLALWARRLMGEALSQAQRVVAERDALSTMLVGGVADGFDLAEVGRMFSRITEAHTKRMAALGLAA
jgi:hypothetical protein